MTKQIKRKGKIKMKQYNVGDVVQFLGDEYKVVEVLQDGEALHIKKIAAPFNTMVVPRVKLAGESEEGNVFHTGGAVPEDITEVLEDLGHKLPDVDKVFDPLEGYDDQEVPDFEDVTNTLDFSVKPDLLYRPDDSITL